MRKWKKTHFACATCAFGVRNFGHCCVSFCARVKNWLGSKLKIIIGSWWLSAYTRIAGLQKKCLSGLHVGINEKWMLAKSILVELVVSEVIQMSLTQNSSERNPVNLLCVLPIRAQTWRTWSTLSMFVIASSMTDMTSMPCASSASFSRKASSGRLLKFLKRSFRSPLFLNNLELKEEEKDN